MSKGSVESSAFEKRTALDRRDFILALGMFAIGTDAFIIAGILPDIARSLSSTIESTGFVVSIFSVSYAIGSPIASALTASWRRSTVLVGGLAAFALANLLSACSPNLMLLLATRVFAAASAGLVAPASYALASTLGHSHKRGKTLAIVAAGFMRALVLGVPLGILIGQHVGWRGSLFFVSIPGGIAALSMHLAGVPEPNAPQQVASLEDQLETICRPATLITVIPFLIWSIANFELYTFVAPVLARHLPSATIPVLLLPFGAGGVAGNFIGGALFDRYGARWPPVVALIMLVCSLATIEFAALLPVADRASIVTGCVMKPVVIRRGRRTQGDRVEMTTLREAPGKAIRNIAGALVMAAAAWRCRDPIQR